MTSSLSAVRITTSSTPSIWSIVTPMRSSIRLVCLLSKDGEGIFGGSFPDCDCYSSLKLFHCLSRDDTLPDCQELSSLIDYCHILAWMQTIITVHNVFAKYGPSLSNESGNPIQRNNNPLWNTRIIFPTFACDHFLPSFESPRKKKPSTG